MAAASLYDDYNDYVIESTVKYKHRLRTTAIVKPSIDPYVMRLMRDDGVVGVRLQWRNVKNLPDITTPEYQKFFRRVRDLDWHVHLNQSGELIETPIAVRMFGWTPADARARTIASMIRIAPRPMLAPSIQLSTLDVRTKVDRYYSCSWMVFSALISKLRTPVGVFTRTSSPS
jgi:hypothetical protein